MGTVARVSNLLQLQLPKPINRGNFRSTLPYDRVSAVMLRISD